MTAPLRFDQDLPILLDALYVSGTPDYRDDLVRQIAATRQRPAWTFPGRWLPVELTTQAVPGSRMPWRTLGVLALIGLLLAAVAAAFVGSQRRPDPFGLAANGRIVYADDGDLYVRDAVDGPSRLLISGPEVETWAVFSLLGDRMAVFRQVEGGEDLWVGDADGQHLVRLGGPFATVDWVEWSPDQAYVAVASVARGVPRIDLVATDGSGSRRLVDFPAMAPTFRPPDGAQLLFRGQAPTGGWSFFLIDAHGGEPIRLDIEGDGIEAGGYDLRGPAWSPSGDRLAWESLVELPSSQIATPGLRIHTASIGPLGEVSDRRRFELDPRADDELYPVFTPDGTQLVFQQRLGPTPADPAGDIPTVDTLFITAADGTGPAESLGIESRPGDGFSAAVAPDGTSLIVHIWSSGEDWLVDPVARTARPTDIGSFSGVSWQRRAP